MKRGATGSLTGRVLLVSVFFLVIPLFIQSFILYKKEYHRIQEYYFHFATLFFFVGIIGGGAVFFLTRRIAKPLKRLCQTMDLIAQGEEHARYRPDWMGFEINDLGLRFNQTLDALALHAQASEELRIGHQIQAQLLSSYIPQVRGVDLAASHFASREVSGDFYDLVLLESGQLLIAIADIAGKGVSACLFSLGLRSMLRAFAHTTPRLAELVRQTNDLYLADAHESSTFATLWIGLYDPISRELTFCSQGHPPALLVRGAEIDALSTNGLALGAQKVDCIAVQNMTLAPGDLLVLYTDGILEAHNSKNQLFGAANLRRIISKETTETARQIGDRILAEVRRFSGSSLQHDDITLVALKILHQ